MHKKRPAKPHKIILFFLMFMLLGGVIILLNQNGNRQNTQSEAAGDCTVSTTQMQIKPLEQQLFDLVNAYRAQQGAAALTWSNDLKKPAAWLSSDMARMGVLSHTDSLGRDTITRLPDCGFSVIPGYGETLASGPPIAQEILDAWKASPTHNQILINPNYKLGAVAIELDATGQTGYWTLDVGGTPQLFPSLTPVVSTNPTAGISTVPTVTTAIPTGTTAPSATPAPTNTIVPTATLVPTNTPIPTPTPTDANPSPTIGALTVDMQIGVKVKISGIGIGGNIYPRRLSRKVIAIVTGPGVQPIVTGNAFLAYDKNDFFTGTIHLGKMNQGIYLVKLYSESSLQQLAKPEFQLLLANRVNPIPPVTLYQGDLNHDNVLSIADYNLALACFQQKVCQTADMIDFNDDKITDITDYNILLRSFAQSRGN